MNKEKSKKARLSKKGAEMTVGTLVVIVLAIIVLVVLALGFGAGWSNLWSKVTGFFSPVNVDSTKQACDFVCTTQSAYAYCCQIREVRFEKGATPELMTCDSGKTKLGVECDLSCDVLSSCGDLICRGTPKKDCDKNTETADPTKKFKSEGEVIPYGEKCCVPKTCKGTATPCTGLSQTDCPKQKGCTYSNNVCSGNPTPCTDSQFLDEAKCSAQKGCSWS